MVARYFFAFMNLYDFLYENCLNLKDGESVKSLMFEGALRARYDRGNTVYTAVQC